MQNRPHDKIQLIWAGILKKSKDWSNALKFIRLNWNCITDESHCVLNEMKYVLNELTLVMKWNCIIVNCILIMHFNFHAQWIENYALMNCRHDVCGSERWLLSSRNPPLTGISFVIKIQVGSRFYQFSRNWQAQPWITLALSHDTCCFMFFDTGCFNTGCSNTVAVARGTVSP